MKAGGELVTKNESALLFFGPRVRQLKFNGIGRIGGRGGANDPHVDGLAIPFGGGSRAVEGIGRNKETETLQRLIAGIE